MKRALEDMSLEELWELFPIFLVEPKECWEQQYEEMEALLKEVLADLSGLRISHIGSTAIKGIWSKDTVDVLVEVGADADIEHAAQLLEQNGFIRMLSSETRISLNRGYTPEGFADKVYHIHVRYRGDNDEVFFRDYLNAHPDVAAEYEKLKLSLWKAHEHDRDAYTEGKTAFVKKWTEEAKRLAP